MAPTVREQELRNFLGGFNFPGTMVSSPIAPFSGGEKARLALALIVWQKPNLLLLDEPTNHLDLETREALTVALAQFEGTLVLVSHDRHLLRATTEEFLIVADGSLKPFDGDLDDYRDWLFKDQTGPWRLWQRGDPPGPASPRMACYRGVFIMNRIIALLALLILTLGSSLTVQAQPTEPQFPQTLQATAQPRLEACPQAGHPIQLTELSQADCCKGHKGVCGCRAGKIICCDNTASPNCTCHGDSGIEN
jgi:energy-coupling factor transporter ATP-binding protein EcfA2